MQGWGPQAARCGLRGAVGSHRVPLLPLRHSARRQQRPRGPPPPTVLPSLQPRRCGHARQPSRPGIAAPSSSRPGGSSSSGPGRGAGLGATAPPPRPAPGAALRMQAVGHAPALSNSSYEEEPHKRTTMAEVIDATINLPWSKAGSWLVVALLASLLKDFFGVRALCRAALFLPCAIPALCCAQAAPALRCPSAALAMRLCCHCSGLAYETSASRWTSCAVQAPAARAYRFTPVRTLWCRALLRVVLQQPLNTKFSLYFSSMCRSPWGPSCCPSSATALCRAQRRRRCWRGSRRRWVKVFFTTLLARFCHRWIQGTCARHFCQRR